MGHFARKPSRMSRPSPRSDSARRRAPRPLGPWKHGRIPVVGIIGGIGSGKSLAAAEIAAHGALVLDADRVGHALLDQRPAREEAVAAFGPEILDEADPEKVDRSRLGQIVFADPEKLKALEAILHPRMRRTFEKAIARVLRQRSHKAVLLDAAILLEAGWDDLCDVVVFVDAPDALRAERVATHRGWSAEKLAGREKAQWSLDRKRMRAGVVLPNDGDVEALRARIRPLWRSWMAKGYAAAKPRTKPGLPPPGRPE